MADRDTRSRHRHQLLATYCGGANWSLVSYRQGACPLASTRHSTSSLLDNRAELSTQRVPEFCSFPLAMFSRLSACLLAYLYLPHYSAGSA